MRARSAFNLANIILIIVLTTLDVCTAVQLKLTNLRCESLDESLVKFNVCRLKVIKRGVIAANINASLFKVVSDVEANVALYKKASGYKPFLYNITVDFCELQKKSLVNIVAKIVFNFIAEFSNINHTCPYNHDIVIKDLVLTENKFRLVPLPSGEYMIKFALNVLGLRVSIFEAFFSRIE